MRSERPTAGRVLVVSLVVLAFVGPARAQAGDVTCAPSTAAAYDKIVTDWKAKIAETPSPGAETTDVPIVISLMETGGTQTVQDAWTPEKVDRHFGVNGGDTANAIWKQAAIRFAVTRIDVCQYAPPPPAVTSGEIRVPLSLPGPSTFRSNFIKLGAFFAPHQINVLLWRRLHGNVDGLGLSIKSGRGKAWVWLDTKCVDGASMSAKKCAKKIAHEFGHALGLNHACGRPGESPPAGGPLCRATFERCDAAPGQDRDMLMRSMDPPGTDLCSKEEQAARAGVKRLLSN